MTDELRIVATIEKLEKWMRHDDDCARINEYKPCDCGMDEAIKEAREVLRADSAPEIENAWLRITKAAEEMAHEYRQRGIWPHDGSGTEILVELRAAAQQILMKYFGLRADLAQTTKEPLCKSIRMVRIPPNQYEKPMGTCDKPASDPIHANDGTPWSHPFTAHSFIAVKSKKEER